LTELVRRSPGDERFFLMGADVVRSFAQWREPLAVMRMAELVVLRRGDIDTAEIEACLPRDPSGRGPAYRVLASRRVDVSSTDVRARVRAGKSIHGFVPDAVRHYIEHTGLYRGGTDREDRNVQSTDR
jgi:nicotinate-nucleotide adenylyltransferase